jgi:hypothetical protein
VVPLRFTCSGEKPYPGADGDEEDEEEALEHEPEVGEITWVGSHGLTWEKGRPHECRAVEVVAVLGVSRQLQY